MIKINIHHDHINIIVFNVESLNKLGLFLDCSAWPRPRGDESISNKQQQQQLKHFFLIISNLEKR